MKKLHVVKLTPAERRSLQEMLSGGQDRARKLMHARILLKADQGPQGPAWKDTQIAEALEVSVQTIERIRKRWAQEGLSPALEHRKPRRQYKRKLDGDCEAHLIALACSEAPEGHGRWTLRLLADRMVELGHADTLSYQTVRRTLKKTSLSLG